MVGESKPVEFRHVDIGEATTSAEAVELVIKHLHKFFVFDVTETEDAFQVMEAKEDEDEEENEAVVEEVAKLLAARENLTT